MDKLNEKYSINRENFIIFINRLCNKRAINIQLSNEESEFDNIKKLNKIMINIKLKKMMIGYNILDEKILDLIALNKEKFVNDDIEKLYIYFYFYNAINELYEMPNELKDPRIKWQIIKQINSDTNLTKRYTYIDGELLQNK